MIAVSTNPIKLPLTVLEFNDFFSDIRNLKPLFQGGKIIPLPGTQSEIEFLLKRVSVFSLSLDKEKGEFFFQLKNTKKMAFQTIIRFEYIPDHSGIAIHLETDTNLFMELFLEKRIKNMVQQIVKNLHVQFKN